jgi:hypothetical protein
MRLAFAGAGRVFVFNLFCHAAPLRSVPIDKARYAASASRSGGTTDARRRIDPWVTASLICAALAPENSDHRSAIAPVTKGAATLVPPRMRGSPSTARLVMPAPRALRPRLPIEPPRFESFVGLPRSSQATTGMTQGCRVMAELPRAP